MPLSTNNTVVSNKWNRDFRSWNVAFMFISIFIICFNVWAAMHYSIYYRCSGQWEYVSCIVFAVFLFGLSLFGLLADVRKKPYLLNLYQFMLLVLILFFIIIAIFFFVVTAKGVGKEYKFGDYPSWIQKRISNWNNIKNKCLLNNGFCSNNDGSLEDFQPGCCKPPSECNFVNQSPMVWNRPKTTDGNYTINPDCGVWDNDPKELCFNCDTCKVAFLEDMKLNLKAMAEMISFFILFLVIWYVFGTTSFLENRSDSFTLPR